MIDFEPAAANRILGSLDGDEYRRIAPHFLETQLPLHHYVHRAQEAVEYLTFPLSGIVSLIMMLADGHTAEIAVVGREGVVGTSVYTGGMPPPYEAVMQAAGAAVRLPAPVALEEFQRNGNLQRSLLRYSQSLLAQSAQTALCNRHHTVEQQLARWLLLSMDRLGSDDVLMTQGMIAEMLGVRREGVTMAASRLQQQDVISYRRGQIRVIDRAKLAGIACECYAVINQEYQAAGLLPFDNRPGTE